MSAKYWKLVITPISTASAAAAAREVVVEGDNWLSALRAARKALGEDGAVPTGASCVMSATGEVTILDSAKRLRYVLSRTEAAPTPPAAAAPQATPAPAAAAPQPPAPAGAPRRSPTVAYSPSEAAAIRAQALAGTGNAEASQAPQPGAAEAAAKAPAFSPARPLSRPPAPEPEAARPDPRRPIPSKRSATVAYASEPAPQAPAAAPTPAGAATPAENAGGAAAAAATPSLPPPAVSLPPPAALALPEAPTPKVAPPGELPVAPLEAAPRARPIARPGRKQTMAYSPEESAAIRAQMGAAGAGTSTPVRTSTSHATTAQDHLVQTEVPSMMITLGHRDEEPSPESPLTYRERSYFWQPPAAREEVERALRAELQTLRQALSGRARGQYINLAVFDHAFQDKPQRPPVATLQWKDWRGEPVFAWLAEQASAQWAAPQAGQPVTTSYFPSSPSAPAPVAPSAPVPVAPSAPPPVAPSAPPVAPSAPPPAASAPVPDNSNRATQPTRRPTPVPDNQQGKRETTGEQDLRLAVAFEATQDLYFLRTPADGLDFAVRLLGELIPAEAVSGCIYDINTDEFRFVAVSGTGAGERRAAAVRGNIGLFAAAAHSGLDTLVVSDIANEPRYDPDSDGRAGLLASNMAFFVLQRGGQLFGMLQIINREGPKGFREADIAVGSYVANQVTSFLREKRGLRT